MEPHRLNTDLPPQSLPPPQSSGSTPVTSPGLFSPSLSRCGTPMYNQDHSGLNTPTTNATVAAAAAAAAVSSPYLHPLQNHRVRETHKALVDMDLITGRKIINNYEVIEELGRGMHGKVKLVRNLENNENVAIKIVPRFSKKRRLGRVTASPEEKTKKEIAILKKIRHPNVVALLEIIDDPELKKIYMVLEHVELGEVVWRKKGPQQICGIERRRVETEMRGDLGSEDEERYYHILEKRRTAAELQRAKMMAARKGPEDFWSLEYGAADEDDPSSRSNSYATNLSNAGKSYEPATFAADDSRATSRAPSRARSHHSSRSEMGTPLPSEPDLSSSIADEDVEGDLETPVPLPLRSQPGSYTALDRNVSFGSPKNAFYRNRTPSMADSFVSVMSSVDYGYQAHDPFADDFSYVPCLTIEEARATFRDTVLGLEYLHYEGVVHRDIKPANLLWTRDHRVKISDFGVSYFGRPIRDGEPDELVSESEARDFDDDLELAKTVGTPAFFAPELCYTDPQAEQPKISEQIDVWSLGVTLYCLIFARIPFMAEDEFQMFKKIATEDVYIPRRRLRPVDPHQSPTSTSLYQGSGSEQYRDENTLAYEEIDDLLLDLLRKMLIKNPNSRIRLRDVKRHPWVVQGIPNLVGWLDDTDPSRRTAGRRIEVDEREVSHAVVPLTFLERARSTLRKAMDKVMNTRAERGDSTHSRRRATSSVGSSVGDTNYNVRDARRKSIRPGDDAFSPYRESEHPLAQSVMASPLSSLVSAQDGYNFQQSHLSRGDLRGKDAEDAASSPKDVPSPRRRERPRSVSNAILALTPSGVRDNRPVTPSPATARAKESDSDLAASLRKARDVLSTDDSSRSRSVDRGLFASHDKRAEAKVAVSTAVAPGNMAELPRRPLSVCPPETGIEAALSSPMFFSPVALKSYQHGQPHSDSNILANYSRQADSTQRPRTSHRTMNFEGRTPPPRNYNTSNADSFQRAFERLARSRQQEFEELRTKPGSLNIPSAELSPAHIPCPPSPDDELASNRIMAPSRGDTVCTGTTSPGSFGTLATPLTSPSDIASPAVAENVTDRNEEGQIFRSDPSLPALLSGASSVSADPEGDFLLKPGSIDRPSLIDTTDSLTPPALLKEPMAGFPMHAFEHGSHTLLLDRPAPEMTTSSFSSPRSPRDLDEEDDSNSDSDGGLVMARSKKKTLPPKDNSAPVVNIKRRDTQTSVGSTDTAKKVLMQSG